MGTEQKVAVITGASKGIGAGLVERFLERGYCVVANSRTIKQSEVPNLLSIPGNIAEPETGAAIFKAAIDRFGRIDTLVNNAGAFIPKPFTSYSRDDFEAVLSVNLAGFFHVSQQAAAQMLQQGTGHIVNITSSLVAEQPLKAVPAALTALTKGGLNAVTRALAIEYAGVGIRVNAVAPGAIRTPMHAPESHGFLATMHPLGRMGAVQDIVDAVLYLEGATFVTGEILHVDGGAHAGHW